MKIGIFSDEYLPNTSGVVSSIEYLCRGLRELGHEVYVVAPSSPGWQPADKYTITISSSSQPIVPGFRLAIPTRKQIDQLISLDFDVIHSHTQHNIGILASYIAKKLNIPHVNTMHTLFPELVQFYPARSLTIYGYTATLYSLYFRPGTLKWPQLEALRLRKPSVPSLHMPRPFLKIRMWQALNRFCSSCDHIIAPSQHLAKTMKEHKVKTYLSVVPNGIDVDFFAGKRKRIFLDGGLRVLLVARASFEKRQDAVIKSLPGLKDVEVHIVGDGPALESYKTLATKLGVSEQVYFYGKQSREFVKQQLLKSDVFVLASHGFDTQGMVMIEAAASGLPVVYCDPRLKETVSSDYSILIGQKPADFKNLFKRLLKDKYDLKCMSQNARREAKRFDYLKYAKQVESIYLEPKS